MSLKLPDPDESVLARREEIAAALRSIVPGEGIITQEAELRPYESDGLTAYRQLPMIVALPSTLEQVSAVLAYCYAEGIRVVPRGAGTSLSGGALPLSDAVLLGMGKFNRILEIDYDDRIVVAQPGVTNLAITRAVEAEGFYYAPDPSSQIACTIGGKHELNQKKKKKIDQIALAGLRNESQRDAVVAPALAVGGGPSSNTCPW